MDRRAAKRWDRLKKKLRRCPGVARALAHGDGWARSRVGPRARQARYVKGGRGCGFQQGSCSPDRRYRTIAAASCFNAAMSCSSFAISASPFFSFFSSATMLAAGAGAARLLAGELWSRRRRSWFLVLAFEGPLSCAVPFAVRYRSQIHLLTRHVLRFRTAVSV